MAMPVRRAVSLEGTTMVVVWEVEANNVTLRCRGHRFCEQCRLGILSGPSVHDKSFTHIYGLLLRYDEPGGARSV